MNWKGFKSREVGSEGQGASGQPWVLAPPPCFTQDCGKDAKMVYRAAWCGTVYK